MKLRESVLPSEHFRPLKAAAIVLAILLVAPGLDAVVRIVVPMQVANAADVGIDAAYLTGGEDASASLERIESAATASEANVPDEFSAEVGLLLGARDVRASEQGVLVVGYVVDGDCSDVARRLEAHMEARGWTGVALGKAAGATFAKSSGSCTWALATCTQVGSDTSVVMRCVVK